MRRTATQKFLEGCTVDKVENPPRELTLHLRGGCVLRVCAYLDGDDYGLNFIFEKDGQRVDGSLNPILDSPKDS